MSKKKEEVVESEVVTEEVRPAEEVNAGEPTYTREDIAASKKFREHKWIVYAVIAKGETVTLKEAERRVENYLKREI